MTNSEVATMRFLRQNTDIPVPKVFVFDDSSDNELGFEWILMEILPGTTLENRWRKLSGQAKRDLVTQVTKYQTQLFRCRFSGIGNLQVTPDEKVSTPVPADLHQVLPSLGPIVPSDFLGEKESTGGPSPTHETGCMLVSLRL